ncbi:MAG: hypothetical protein EHM49_00010 [Deltaproteobacteria bacterium]|nr:MAG: hypothetical protein EHM49_00010 [Deltaproteobacteria bacterium]
MTLTIVENEKDQKEKEKEMSRDRKNDAIEVWAWIKMASVFIDGLIENRYPSPEYTAELARTLKEELDKGILGKAKRVAEKELRRQIEPTT